MRRCTRCGHRLDTELCGFCLVEVLGLRMQPKIVSVEAVGALLRAVFVEHWSLHRPLVVRPS